MIVNLVKTPATSAANDEPIRFQLIFPQFEWGGLVKDSKLEAILERETCMSPGSCD